MTYTWGSDTRQARSDLDQARRGDQANRWLVEKSSGRCSTAIGWTALAILVGFAIRAAVVVPAGFPLNDGGLFLVMVEALRQSAPALPLTVSYNGLEIPFAYPPLAFAAAAALANAGMAPLDTLRFLPLGANSAALVAFAGLARTTLATRLGAVLAALLFAVMPGSYVWQIMGGGLTRSFGFLFAVLGLIQAYRLATRGGWAPVILLALFAGLTALSHLEMAWFLTLGTACILLGYARRWTALRDAAIAALGAAVLASPWWLTILARHGPGPLLAASQTGSLVMGSVAEDGTALIEPSALAANLAVVAILAVLIALRNPFTFVLGGLGILLVLESRSFAWLSAVPLALILGGFAGDAIAHFAGRSPGRPRGKRRPLLQLVGKSVGATIIAVMAFYLHGGALLGRQLPAIVLSPDERAAMAWMAATAPPGARFLVISGDPWAMDRSSEWFPVLAQHVSVATPQGAEWLPGREFARRILQHIEVQRCGARDAECLEEWARKSGKSFDYVYVAERAGGACCAPLRVALEQDPRYRRVFASAGASIFSRSTDPLPSGGAGGGG